MLPSGAFRNVSGNLASPIFAEIAINGHTTESNGSLKPVVNVTHWKALTPFPGGSAATLGASLQAVVEVAMQGVTTTDFAIDNYTVRMIDDPLAVPAVVLSGAAGTVTGDRAASFVAAVLRKNTGVPSRSFRGSMHFGAVPESMTTKDVLNAAGIAAYTILFTLWNGMAASGISDGVQPFFPVVISTILSNRIATPSIFTGASIQTYTLNEKLGTMKRRKEKGA